MEKSAPQFVLLTKHCDDDIEVVTGLPCSMHESLKMLTFSSNI
jgi:hypothetical protein